MVGIESPGPRTARDELWQTRLGEVDGFVAVNELGRVWRTSAIREQGPCLGKVLGTRSVGTGRLNFIYCRLTSNAPSWAVARSTSSRDRSPAIKTSRYTVR